MLKINEKISEDAFQDGTLIVSTSVWEDGNCHISYGPNVSSKEQDNKAKSDGKPVNLSNWSEIAMNI